MNENGKKINVLYLSYDGMTDPLGQSQVLPYLEGLSKKGLSFTLVSVEKKDRFTQKREKIEKICTKSQITWVPLSYTKKPPIISTLLNYQKMIKKALGLHQQTNFQIVHCRSYIAALAGLRLKRKCGMKLIFDMRGFWADERVDGNIWNLENPVFKLIYRFFKSKEKEFLSISDAVVSLTKTAKEEILSWNIRNASPGKVSVIPCAADFSLFRSTTEHNKATARQRLNMPPDSFVLSYMGSIGTWYLLDDMLRFFSLVKTQYTNAKFLILTPEPEENIRKVYQLHHLKSEDIIVKFIQREALPGYISASDFSVFFIKPSYSKMASSPTKLGELLAMGIPVICNNKIGDVEEIVEQTHSGFCIHDFSDTTFRETISKMDSLKFNPNKIREKARDIFDLTSGIESYWKVYSTILKEEANSTSGKNKTINK